MWIDQDQRVFTMHSEIRRGFSKISFPAVITDEVLLHFGIEPVADPGAPAVVSSEVLEEDPPAKVGGIWTRQWRKRALTPEEQTERRQAKAKDVRERRDERLAACDWTQLLDTPQATQAAWAVYRQALRDVPQQPGFPFDITWPTKP